MKPKNIILYNRHAYVGENGDGAARLKNFSKAWSTLN
jgi:hypothetical protein